MGVTWQCEHDRSVNISCEHDTSVNISCEHDVGRHKSRTIGGSNFWHVLWKYFWKITVTTTRSTTSRSNFENSSSNFGSVRICCPTYSILTLTSFGCYGDMVGVCMVNCYAILHIVVGVWELLFCVIVMLYVIIKDLGSRWKLETECQYPVVSDESRNLYTSFQLTSSVQVRTWSINHMYHWIQVFLAARYKMVGILETKKN